MLFSYGRKVAVQVLQRWESGPGMFILSFLLPSIKASPPQICSLFAGVKWTGTNAVFVFMELTASCEMSYFFTGETV